MILPKIHDTIQTLIAIWGGLDFGGTLLRAGGGIMIHQQIERLVLDVVLSNADDEVVRDLNSGATFLEVDHLTMTYIVLALENRLGIELPTHLEDARTIGDLVSGVLETLRASAEMKCQVALDCGLSQARTVEPVPGSYSRFRGSAQLSPSRPRRKKPIHRGARVENE